MAKKNKQADIEPTVSQENVEGKKISKDLQRRLDRGWVQIEGTGKGNLKKDEVYTVSKEAAKILIEKGYAK